MALYEVTLRQRYYEQLIVNVFSYATAPGIGVTPNALELLTLMGFIPAGDPLVFPTGTIAVNLQSIQNDYVEFLSAEARELYSLTDFYEAVYSPPLIGAWDSSTGLSPLTAFGLYTSRVRLDIRRGFKRFVGVSEDAVLGGGILTTDMLGYVSDLGDLMSATLAGAAADYVPAVISRERVVNIEDGKVSYQLYPTVEEQEEHTATGIAWSPYTQVRSQTSRQYGRGQ